MIHLSPRFLEEIGFSVAMRLLIVCPDAPYPPRDGGSLRIVNLARSLATRVETALLTYVRSAAEARPLEAFGRSARMQVRYVQRPARRNLWTRAWHKLIWYYLPSLFSETPGVVHFNLRPVMQQGLADVLHSFQPDVILWEYWFMSAFAEQARRHAPSAFQVLDEIDIEWLRLQRRAVFQPGPRSLGVRFMLRKIRRYEAGRYRSVNRVVALTGVDAQVMQREHPDITHPWVLPVGLYAEEYPDLGGGHSDRIVFFGSFRHAPNVDAVKILLREVFPPIQRAYPDVNLDILGMGLPRSLERAACAHPGVRVLGFQPDIRPALSEAAVVLAPLRFGSGVKVKLLEAMALGKAVVTTPIGAEGIEAEPGTDWIVADEPEKLADETIRLLKDLQTRIAMGRRGRERILRRHHAPRIADNFLKQLQGER